MAQAVREFVALADAWRKPSGSGRLPKHRRERDRSLAACRAACERTERIARVFRPRGASSRKVKMFDWITGLIERGGYLGVALLMFLENIFPPIPSELIMPLAGYQAAQGSLSLAGVIVAGTIGSLTSTLVWYAVGRLFGAGRLRNWCARHGRWIGLAPDEVDDICAWFNRRNGAVAVLVGRLVPGVRTLISVPAGIAAMPLGRFVAFSAIGTAAWTALLAMAGYLLGSRFVDIDGWLQPISNVIVVVAVIIYLYRVVTFNSAAARRAALTPAGQAEVSRTERSSDPRS